MIVEIHGGGFKNKGAELMLITVMNKLSSQYQDIEFSINPSKFNDSLYCEKYGLLEFYPYPKARGGRLFIIRFLLNQLTSRVISIIPYKKLKTISHKEPDVLIDISGVRFSDKASKTAMNNFLYIANFYKKQGKPVILLPQMFGAFEKNHTKKAILELGNIADLIFARDRFSFRYLEEILKDNPILKSAPDITVFYEEGIKESNNENYCCIVPNTRILDKGSKKWKEIYLDRLVYVLDVLNEKNINPIILIHSNEENEDYRIAQKIKHLSSNTKCQIKQENDPKKLKSFIANSDFIIASRYHSIVSALSSSVPAIVLGWAHKYDGLLEEFGAPELQHNADNDLNHLDELIKKLLDKNINDQIRKTLASKKQHISYDNDVMWEDVFATIDKYKKCG